MLHNFTCSSTMRLFLLFTAAARPMEAAKATQRTRRRAGRLGRGLVPLGRIAQALPTVCFAILLATPVVGQGTGFLYWADVDGEGVWRAQLDGSQVKRAAGTFEPDIRLAVDTVNGKLYFAVKRNNRAVEEIWRSDLQGRSQERVVDIAIDARAIALDPAADRLYWTDGPRIRRASLDGTGAETLFTSTVRIEDLALDLSATPDPRAYFIDETMGGRELRSMLLDGSDVQTLPNAPGAMVGLAVDEANDRLFIATQFANDSLYRLNQDGTGLVSFGIDRSGADLQVTGGRLYFNDGSLRSLDLDGNDLQTVFTTAEAVSDFVVDLEAARAFFFAGQIHRIDLDGNNETPLIGNTSLHVHDLAVATDGTLVLASPGNDRITRIDAASGDVQPLLASRGPIGDIRGLALDGAASTVYWASLDGWVARAGTDGSGLVQLTGESQPHDVAVHRTADAVYWTAHIGDSGAPDLSGVIRKANLDLQFPEDVLTGLPRQIRGLDVDEDTGQIYFTDHGTDQIRRVDADGTGLVDIVAATNPHDVVVDELGGWVYWTEGISDNSDPNAAIRRFPLAGPGTAEDVVTGLSSFIRDLTLVYLPGEIFEDNFESGDLGEWSAVH